MEQIIPFKGKVKFPITLDPGVWIFDDRRIDLDTYFVTKQEEVDELEVYIKATSKHWEREIQEGATFPPTLKSERKFEKEKILQGTFAMELIPFLKNAEPSEDAKTLVIETAEAEINIPLNQAKELLLAYSKVGKPLKEDGPVHVLFKDGSNQNNPIRYVRAFRVE